MTINARRNLVCMVWSAVGVLLIWRGLPYAGVTDDPAIEGLTGSSTWIALAAALPIGIVKGLTALRSAARRAANHIERTGERGPAWSVFSGSMLSLVVLFVGVGFALRLAPYDPTAKAWVVGILYPAVGVSLLIGGQFARTLDPVTCS